MLFLRILIVSLLIFSIGYLGQIGFFKIKNVSCQTQYGPCSQKDEELIASFRDKNFFLLSNTRVENTLLQNSVNNKVFIQKVFPNTLKINIEKRKPFISIGQEELLSRGVFILDKDGVISEFVKNSSLPLLVIPPGTRDMGVGVRVGEKIQKAAIALSSLYISQKVTKANLADDFLSFELPDGINVYFPLDRDPDALIGALQLIVSGSRIEGSLPKSIDLRYSNPVIKY